MVIFPPCKINLGLRIIRKRSDGFHDLETVFYPLPWNDILEVTRPEDPEKIFVFDQTGLVVDGRPEDNICFKAWKIIKENFPNLPPVHLLLYKNIPMGAGLGGGSADGAYTLRLLNDCFKLGASKEQLHKWALQLGSDCPFFIEDGPCVATGRGEILEPIGLQLKGHYVVVVNPGIHVNTGWAFSQLQLVPQMGLDFREIILQPIAKWQSQLINDFEGPVFHHYPAIGAIKNDLINLGARYASMSGSGSTVFGIFEQEPRLPKFLFPEEYLVKTFAL